MKTKIFTAALSTVIMFGAASTALASDMQYSFNVGKERMSGGVYSITDERTNTNDYSFKKGFNKSRESYQTGKCGGTVGKCRNHAGGI